MTVLTARHWKPLPAILASRERVTFAGQMLNPERALGLLDVFALSSDTEQMPLSLLEAMAAALPVVATDVGDVRGMLTDDNRRLVVPRDDEPAFTAALSTLLTDATLRRRLGTRTAPAPCGNTMKRRWSRPMMPCSVQRHGHKPALH